MRTAEGREFESASGSLFVTTKIECCPGNAIAGSPVKGFVACMGKKNATADIDHNLAVLGLPYSDLLLLHWPCDNVEETVHTYRAMEEALRAGKARAIGVSNFNASALGAILPRVNVKPVLN